MVRNYGRTIPETDPYRSARSGGDQQGQSPLRPAGSASASSVSTPSALRLTPFFMIHPCLLPLISATTRYLPDAKTEPGIHASPSAAIGGGERGAESEGKRRMLFSLSLQKSAESKKK